MSVKNASKSTPKKNKTTRKPVNRVSAAAQARQIADEMLQTHSGMLVSALFHINGPSTEFWRLAKSLDKHPNADAGDGARDSEIEAALLVGMEIGKRLAGQS